MIRSAARSTSMEAAGERPVDPAVLALARAMARLAAREDHAAEQAAINRNRHSTGGKP
jgi:hypothetical protein